MPSLGEIIGKNSVSLVITWLTLESIKRPIGPVNISLLQISDQMFPRNVSIIVAKLSQEVGIAQSPYKSLSVGQFFLELLVRDKVPSCNIGRSPAEVIEMPCIHQFIWDLQVQRGVFDPSQIELPIQPSHENKPVRCQSLHLVGTYLSSPLPVCQRVAVAPGSIHPMRLPQLIPQVSSNNPGIVPVPQGKGLGILEEHVFGKLSAPPKSISILVGTAPLGSAGVVVENYHQTYLCQDLHCDVKYLHPRLAYQLRIGSQVFLGDGFVLEEELEGVGEPDAVHLKFVPNVHSYFPYWPELKTIDAVATHVCPRPVPTSKFDPLALVIDDLDSLGGQGERYVLDVKEGPLSVEINLVIFEFAHKIPVTAKI